MAMPSETKLVWNSDNVRDVAESVGISALNDDAVRKLTQDVEYRVGQVIEEAMRFMHQAKRTVLGTQDISQALRVLDVEPLFGYESTRPLRFGEASLGPGQPLFYIEDEEVDFEKLINAPLPKVPRDMSFTAHWLAVEGVQPSIPQNPTTVEARATDLVAKGPGANPSLGALAGNDNISFKPLVKHVVSKELILFFDKIRAAILDDDPDPEVVALRASALASVSGDPGLHQLVPYFVQLISDKVTHALTNAFVLRQMMELVTALISNQSLFIQPYVTSLIPPVLTCLCRKTTTEDLNELREWYELRDHAASLVGQICRKYAESSGQLKPRLAKTCLAYFLDPNKSLGEHYGAICGMQAIAGRELVRAALLPNVKPYEAVLSKHINERGADDTNVNMVIGALVKAISSLSDADSIANGTNGTADDDVSQIEEYLGQIVGRRIIALNDHKLNKAIFDAREKLGDK